MKEVDIMKIVSWNCNGKFREKCKYLATLNADIYIVQECEDPDKYMYSSFIGNDNNYIWKGKEKRGIGIFAKSYVYIEKNNWEDLCLHEFMSVKIDGRFDIVCVWANAPYIHEYYIYQYANYQRINSDTIIIGDFNSNAIWDKKNSERNHKRIVSQLEEKGLVSAYHFLYNEKQGEEKEKTFFMYRRREKGYHIDHCFVNPDRIKSYVVGTYEWLDISDHLPIILDIEM